MFRSALVLVLLTAAALLGGERRLPAQSLPRIRIALPAGAKSEDAQITYVMIGAFGGWGQSVSPMPERTEYEIIAGVQNMPAESVRLVAYLPGCEMESRAIEIKSQLETVQLYCSPVAWIPMRGKIEIPSPLPRGAKVEVNYLAEWADDFFNIKDGPIPTFHIADVTPDEDGSFEVSLPDLYGQNLGAGEFSFAIKGPDSERRRIHPEGGTSPFGDLPLQASYPGTVRFVLD